MKDGDLYLRTFVKIEILPLGSLSSIDLKDWQYKIDEEGTLPGWYEEEKELWQTRCLNEVLRIIVDINKTGHFGDSLYLQGTQIKDLGKLKIKGEVNRDRVESEIY
ncbi:MAG: hypothetical protein V1709_00915 [Planctomycetota bacterium]